MSKPKLPNASILFEWGHPVGFGAGVATDLKHKRAVTVRYAPIQKPKVCVWKDDTEDEFWRAPCGKNALYPPGFDMTYCPNCGGKIKVTK